MKTGCMVLVLMLECLACRDLRPDASSKPSQETAVVTPAIPSIPLSDPKHPLPNLPPDLNAATTPVAPLQESSQNVDTFFDSPGYAPDLHHDQGVNGDQASALNEYGRELGKGMLKDYLHIDLDEINKLDLTRFLPKWDMRGEFGPAELEIGDSRSNTHNSATFQNTTAPEPPSMALQIRIEQNGDALRLRNDQRDIPFAFRLESDAKIVPKVLELKTYAYIPLSYKDEIKVGTSFQLPDWKLPVLYRILKTGGFDSPWIADSYYSNRLGESFLDSGLGTQFHKNWSFFYRYRLGISDGTLNHRVGIATSF